MNDLTNLQKVLQYLPHDKGAAVSTIEISTALYIADPRRAIAYLRKYGYCISDYWKTSSRGKKYKVYYIEGSSTPPQKI